jgi:hypothetical protein
MSRLKFQYGETVTLKEDHPGVGLRAGDTGVVVALYQMDPPAYDVTFCDLDGREFDGFLYEEDLEPLTKPAERPLPGKESCVGKEHKQSRQRPGRQRRL